MKAVIMAGGEGTRLRPLTCDIPKPLVRLVNAPIMEHTIRLLRDNGTTDIAVTCGYLGEKIKEHFGDGSALGVKLSYFFEDAPLGTAGGVKNAAGFIDGDFLCISGSVVTDINLGELISFHKCRGAMATLALTKSPAPMEHSMVVTNPDGRVTRFVDNPDWSMVSSTLISAGIFVLSPKALNYITPGTKSDFARDLFPAMLKDNQGIYALRSGGYWCDIGDPASYRRCTADVLDKKVRLHLPDQQDEGIWLEEGVFLEQGAVVRPPVYIGTGSRIRRGARIEPYSVLGRSVTVSSGAGVKRSIVLDRCRIEENAQLRGCIADEEAVMRRGSAVYEQSVIGRGSIVGENCAVKPSVKIWPGKELPINSVQKKNLIWGGYVNSRIWNSGGIHGELGTEITPEILSRLGAAIGTLCEGGKLAVSDYGSPASAMLKSAFIGGALSTGVKLYDFGEQPLPVSRSGIRFHRIEAGVSINVYTSEGVDYGEARIITSGGVDPDKDFISALRRHFENEDFARSSADTILEAEYLFEYKLFYLKNLINSTTRQSLGYKLILGCGSPWAERLLKSAGNDLNCHVDISENASAADISKAVKDEGADLGAVIDPSCQELTLIDGSGRIIDRDSFALLSAMIVMRTYEHAHIYSPVSAPSGIELLAEKYDAEVTRTRISPPELMQELTRSGDHCLRDQFIYAFDAVGALIKLMDFMKSNNATLSELIAQLPETHMVHTGVDCPEKAKAMERLREQHSENSPDTTDGLRLSFDGGWVLVVPSENGSAISIISQGNTEEYAQELADMCVDELQSFA
ncbi:MAG: NTP transferase domain-containing protein [Oscillospiraceae bacterium]|nr:NTP transferase domain-containing protein [Oscillospiraceae bacterium]